MEQQSAPSPPFEIQPREPTLEEAKFEAERLFVLLDDIDTMSDMAKSDDKSYRSHVERIQAQRWKGRITTDGYRLFWKEPDA